MSDAVDALLLLLLQAARLGKIISRAQVGIVVAVRDVYVNSVRLI